jgi:Zn-dependent protease with chaperone function
MTVNPELFIHKHDKSALQALKVIPGFTQVLKAFMKVWQEQQFNLTNMSTNLRIGEKQLSKYYDMLPPICEKLGIDIPDFYLKLDVTPNAYTYGDTKPFIVITSGLLETLPEELIPTVLAHECGHIACHHTLYTTMGNLLLNGAGIAANYLGLGDIVLVPIQVAFAYWMRCSEFSADRAAIVYDGNADKMIEVCMRFAGLDKDIIADANVEAFIEQAAQYKELVDGNKVNKAMEFYMYNGITHPLTALRAYECEDWQKSESFTNIKEYLNSNNTSHCEKLPLVGISDNFLGKEYTFAKNELDKIGFTNLEFIRRVQADSKKNSPSSVLEIAVNGKTKFEDADWYSRDSIIEVTYYLPESDEEIAAAHPGQIQIPNSSKGYLGRDYNEIVDELRVLGFNNISVFEQEGPKIGLFRKGNSIARIIINGQTQFDKGNWFSCDATIRVTYNTFSK